MLKLRPREHESIILQTSDGDIEIIINQIRASQVKVAINAPDKVGILRTELVEQAEVPEISESDSYVFIKNGMY